MKLNVAVYLACLSVACSSSAPASGHKNPLDAGFGSNPVPITGIAGSAGSASAGDPFGAGTVCQTLNATRACCDGKGMQKCSGTAEFLTWSACLDAKGAAVSCTLKQPPPACGVGEFATKCDAGVDSGIPHHCGDGEFGPSCDNPPPSLCDNKDVNREPEILAGYSPASGSAVSANGQIKVWINDERPALISRNEQIDAATGMITTPGDRTGKAPDGYLWEPALYIAPQTAENGGTPHFPQQIKGSYNNMPPSARGPAMGTQGVATDPAPASSNLAERYTTEDIWDVSALGLPPGTYNGEFVIHDGDRDRAIGCVTITITK